jgi:beta-alanine--pyruvate transaminase
MAPLDMKPNELEPYWVPFTPNRAFKKRPRLFVGAKDRHYFKPDGTKVLDATSGLFCVNAGHCREPIVKAIQDMAAKLDYAPAFQYGHPKVFELASRLSLLAPGDLDYAFFSGRCVCGMWSTPPSSVPNILRLVTMPPTEMPPKLTP